MRFVPGMREIVLAATALSTFGLSVAGVRAATVSPTIAPLLAKGGKTVSAEAAATPLSLTVWLKLHDSDKFAQRVAALYDPQSPTFHHWLNKGDLAPYLPTAGEVTAVRQQLQGHGITSATVTPYNLGIRIVATTGQIQSAFHTVINRATVDGRLVHLAMAAPQLSGSAAQSFEGLGGVDAATPQPLLMFPAQSSRANGKTLARAVPFASGAATTSPLCFSGPAMITLSGTTDSDGTPATATLSGATYGDPAGMSDQQSCTYAPADVRGFYNLNTAYRAGLDGTGQTIVIVDAFLEPTAEADANVFNGLFGLPSFTTTNFQALAPDGGSLTGAQESLTLLQETDLDIEWAHAVAPGAKIDLVQAFSDDEEDLQSALLYAVENHLGNTISLSFGEPEILTSPTALNIFNSIAELAAASGISIQVGSGDNGDYTTSGIPADVNGLASSPFDTAVGGTSVATDPSSNAVVTVGWGNNTNDVAFGGQLGLPAMLEDPPTNESLFFGGSGGGASRFFAKPAYQSALSGTQRLLPDVSALADPFTGVDFVYDVGGTPMTATIGGTSLAAPIFSGMWAILNQAVGAPVGQAAPFVASASPDVIRDVVPFSGPANLTETITDSTGTTTYQPVQISTPPSTTTEFVSALFNTAPLGSSPFYENVSFGTDSSLQTAVGWDDVTGYGTPDVAAAVRLLQQSTK